MDIKRLATGGVDSRLTDSPSSNTTGKASASNAKSASSSADTVTLSSLKDIKTLEQKAKTSSVDNSARIQELKQKIQDGTYRVNPDQVATKLIATELLTSGNNG